MGLQFIYPERRRHILMICQDAELGTFNGFIYAIREGVIPQLVAIDVATMKGRLIPIKMLNGTRLVMAFYCAFETQCAC